MSAKWGGRRAQAWTAAVLDRYGRTCHLQLEGCRGLATTGDHLIPRSVDVTRQYDVTNGRPACLPCNVRRQADPVAPVIVDALDLLRPRIRLESSARAVVRGFYRWAHGSGYLDQDPSDTLPSVRVPAGVPRPTPEHLVRQLLAAEDDRLVFMGMLAAYGGLRVSEIARVHGSDLLDDVLIVTGKGGKVREVPVLAPALLARLEAVGDAWAFPNGYGSHLSPGHVSRLLSRALPGRWTGHTLRHRMGTVGWRGSRNLIGVQVVLGHSRLETTQRYVLGDGRDTREAVAAASQLVLAG